ncbi:Gastricsin [Choanephora cucurbitarum]|uniref:rhizopuspepsin n=1 Tax=Choanephora cucurbitarum TaxID=101091 RepID=A0A1C7NL82_9FUNG|nr:Gastricsin [Choanephora cucurbitarum]
MKLTALLITAAISAVAASKTITVHFTATDRKKLHASTWRASSLGRLISAPLENVDLAYLIDIQLGTPPQPFTLLLDTGSSGTWVPVRGCGRYCGYPENTFNPNNSSTFVASNLLFNIRYGEGFSRGFYGKDTMTINGAAVPAVNFALSDYNDGELTADGADGILGIGPDALSIYNNPDKSVIPTVVTTMFEQNIIDRNVFSVYFQPVEGTDADRQEKRINGEIVFGGYEDRHIVGNVSYVNITSQPSFENYWAVDVDKISVGKSFEKTYTPNLSALVDTGSTLVYLPKEIMDNVFTDVKGARKDFLGQYIVPCNSTNLPNITITMGNQDFVLTSDHYLITSGALALSDDSCYTYIQESPSFVDVILGYGFLQQYVSIYDNENKRIGLAQRA